MLSFGLSNIILEGLILELFLQCLINITDAHISAGATSAQCSNFIPKSRLQLVPVCTNKDHSAAWVGEGIIWSVRWCRLISHGVNA